MRTLPVARATNRFQGMNQSKRDLPWIPTTTRRPQTDIALVRRTFDLVVPISGVAADMFYERLFYMAPSLRRMFPEDMRDQKRKLIMMLAMAVNGLKNLDTLAPQLMALGARHAGYGVKDYHYKTVGEALIWTLERGLADKFTPDGGARLGARLSAGRRDHAGRRRRSRHHAGGGIGLRPGRRLGPGHP